MFVNRHADDPQVRAAAALPPGPEQWAAVRALDPLSLSHHDRLVAVELVERCRAALDADEQPLYAALAHGDAGRERDCAKWVCDELALATGYSPSTCGSRLTVGRALVERFPDTLGLMAAGEITYWYGRALVDETACLPPEKAAVVEKRVLDKAPVRRLGEHRQAVRRAVVAVDPRGAAERATAAQRDRTVWVSGVTDATATLGASRLPPADALAAYAHIDRLARATAGDERTLEQRRADTFLALLRGETLDAVRSVGAKVDVAVSAETLHGDDAPGELPAVGSVPAPVARALPYDAGSRWRRLVTGPISGWLRACGEKLDQPGAWQAIDTDPVEAVPELEPRYQASVRLTRYVRTRDRCCSFPGCTRKVRRSDLDHTVPWPKRDISVANLHPLCRRHHRLKTYDKRREFTNPDGSRTGIALTGRRHTATPSDCRDLS